MTASVYQHQDGRWTLDGDAPGAAIEGRAEWRDSAVGGKALVFNGVDTRLVFADRRWSSLGLWFFAADAGPMTVVDGVELTADGAVAFGALKTPPGRWFSGQWTHLAVTASKIYVNGERAAEGESPKDGALVLGGAGKKAFRGLIDDLRLSSKPWSAEELALAVDVLPWYRPRPHMKEPFAGRFDLKDGDIVAFLGGEGLSAGCASGHLEAQLRLAFKGVLFRSLAWEGDTVFEQRRDVNFGPIRRSLARAGASVVVTQFGQLESLRGDLSAFRDAYDKLLGDVQERTRRIVVLSPTPFQKKAPPLPDAAARNTELAAYVDACRAIAAKRQALFVDLSTVDVATRDGVHPTEAGQKAIAAAVARALGVDERPVPTDLLRSIQEKNRIWFDAWRPMNWAFIEGDRSDQPFSRDARDNRVRGLAIEMQDWLPILRRLEDR
ncbi:MAG TPA: GDSL-type esterase/lipase family protein [Planctomycetota bacterium]